MKIDYHCCASYSVRNNLHMAKFAYLSVGVVDLER